MHLQSINQQQQYNTNFKARLGTTATGNLSKKTRTHARLMDMIENSDVINNQFGKQHDFIAELDCNRYTLAGTKNKPYYRYMLKFLSVSNPSNDQKGNIPIDFDVLYCSGADKNEVYKRFRDLLQSLSLENILFLMNGEIKSRNAKVNELLREHNIERDRKINAEIHALQAGSLKQPAESKRAKPNNGFTW